MWLGVTPCRVSPGAEVIRGVTMPLNIVFGAGGPLLAAWIADTYNSYDVAMYVFMGAYAAGIFFIFLARQPVHPSRKASSAMP